VGLKLNWTRQFHAYADDTNLRGYNVVTLNKITVIFSDGSKKIGL
jgi:hypothetical protein